MSGNQYQTVIDEINAILNDTGLETAVETVINRLVSFGYLPVTSDAIEDAWSLAFCIQKTKQRILIQTAQDAVPDGLIPVLVDMACGEFLNAKYSSGQLSLTGLDLDGMISSVREGDTTVNFSTEGSDETKLKNFIAYLMQRDGELLCYRKMRW